MKFRYYRFLLSPMRQETLLKVDSPLSREQLKNTIFEEKARYTAKTSRTTYVLLIQAAHDKKVWGRIAKKSNTTIHSSAEHEFKEQEVEDWPGSYVAINLDEKSADQSDQFGQIIAMQHNSRAISNPMNCLTQLADEINKITSEHGYTFTIEAKQESTDGFWTTIEQNRDNIQKIVLTYAMPNIFDLKTKVEEGLRHGKNEYGISKATFSMENNAKSIIVSKDNEFLEESIDYISRGGGRYEIHLRTEKKVIKSEDSVETKTFTQLKTQNITQEDFMKLCELVLRGKQDD